VAAAAILSPGSGKGVDNGVDGLSQNDDHEEARMAIFPRIFGQPAPAGPNRRKASVNDRLDLFVATVARQPEETEELTFIIDKNYEIVYTGPAPRK
jgi:hypothetical protein